MNDHEPQSSVPEPIPASNPQPKRTGCRRTCIVILAIVLIPYLFNALIVLGGSFLNQIKWHIKGSPNYTATVAMNAFSPLNGESTITVQQGRVISGTNWRYDRCDGCPPASKYFAELTIENMFSRTYGCALLFPLFTCSYKYDSQLGYPREAKINCPIPDACMTYFFVTDLTTSPP